ncbi:hypothetical protein OBBRIDRAFT_786721 [Obba rivulosa]|uniref:Uncharacterized protein n=1 Tax=Obba rivulosa TaxID=1052685 RepID=A0A8E2DEK8_9APHY|nr:hypothetical protein OBBRIDRAFT_786721 [Obba rivulosa]
MTTTAVPQLVDAQVFSNHAGPGTTAFAETIVTYTDYETAARAACAWANQGKQKVDPTNLELHVRCANVGSHAIPSLLTMTNVPSLVRLDIDSVRPGLLGGNGIHFTAVSLSDDSKKLVAIVKDTPEMDVSSRKELYAKYLDVLEGRSPQFIWRLWETGRAS